MSFPSIIGTETEYGISVRNVKEQDPVAASMLVVSSYSQKDVGSADESTENDIYWDYDQESPLTDARGFVYEGGNVVLVGHGARHLESGIRHLASISSIAPSPPGAMATLGQALRNYPLNARGE